jgi:soluble lytic murein transglycosylase-like protein
MERSTWASDWSGVPQTRDNAGWWQNAIPERWSYTQTFGGSNSSYEPGYKTRLSNYTPISQLGYSMTMADFARWNESEAERLGMNDFDLAGQSPGAGLPTPKNPREWYNVTQWGPMVQQAQQAAYERYGVWVPGEIMYSVIKRESGGNPNADTGWDTNVASGSPQRAIGLMQISNLAYHSKEIDMNQLTDPLYNLTWGAMELAARYVDPANPNANGGLKGWMNAAVGYYSGQYDPTLRFGNDNNPEGISLNTWVRNLQEDLAQFYPSGVSATSGGQGWENIDRWNQQIVVAAAETGTPVNMIKAIMRVESQGNQTRPDGSLVTSPSGAMGLMQVMPYHGVNMGLNLRDPAQNIMAGARILRQMYDQFGTWEMASRAYLLGPARARSSSATDALGTSGEVYAQKVLDGYNELNGLSGAGGLTTGVVGASTSYQAVFGGPTFDITQEFGRTAFAAGQANGIYRYATTLGLPAGSHPGLDIGAPDGTKLYSPVPGTVIQAGGMPWGMDDRYGQSPYTGELRIKLDNGDIVVMSHMSNIAVQMGQRVGAGMFVGQSGNSNGDHLHLEYRKYTPGATSSNYTALDPRQALGGTFAGLPGGGTTTGAGISRPMTYRDMLIAATKGEPIRMGPGGSGAGGWSGFLSAFARGQINSLGQASPSGTVTFDPSMASNIDWLSGFRSRPFTMARSPSSTFFPTP